MEVILPNRWKPRPYQRRLWDYLETGGKRAVAVWHRRAGKDEVCLHWAACAAMQRIGNYWHMLPEASQARKAIWDAINPHTGKRRIDEAFPPTIRVGLRDEDMRIRLVNGSSWQIVGSDNFNSLVGPPSGRSGTRQPFHALRRRRPSGDDGSTRRPHTNLRSPEGGRIVAGRKAQAATRPQKGSPMPRAPSAPACQRFPRARPHWHCRVGQE